MKQKIILILLFFWFCSRSYGLNFDSPRLLKQSDADISVAAFLEDNFNFGLFLINDYGIVDRLNSIIKLGFIPSYKSVGSDMLYAGIEGKILIAERFGGTDNFTVKLGGHYKQRKSIMGLDLSVCVGSMFFKFDNYLGLDFDIDFVGSKVIYPGEFIFGGEFTPFVNKRHSFVVEGAVPITSDPLPVTSDMSKEFDYYCENNYKIGFAYRMGF